MYLPGFLVDSDLFGLSFVRCSGIRGLENVCNSLSNESSELSAARSLVLLVGVAGVTWMTVCTSPSILCSEWVK